MFPHRNIDKYTWMSPDAKIHNHMEHVMMCQRLSAYQVPSVTVVFVVMTCKVSFISLIAKSHKGLEPLSYRGALNVLVQIANKMRLQKKKIYGG
jgi:hypothetical protein